MKQVVRVLRTVLNWSSADPGERADAVFEIGLIAGPVPALSPFWFSQSWESLVICGVMGIAYLLTVGWIAKRLFFEVVLWPAPGFFVAMLGNWVGYTGGVLGAFLCSGWVGRSISVAGLLVALCFAWPIPILCAWRHRRLELMEEAMSYFEAPRRRVRRRR